MAKTERRETRRAVFLSWEELLPYLGKYSDAALARLSGKSPGEIWAKRVEQSIKDETANYKPSKEEVFKGISPLIGRCDDTEIMRLLDISPELFKRYRGKFTSETLREEYSGASDLFDTSSTVKAVTDTDTDDGDLIETIDDKLAAKKSKRETKEKTVDELEVIRPNEHGKLFDALGNELILISEVKKLLGMTYQGIYSKGEALGMSKVNVMDANSNQCKLRCVFSKEAVMRCAGDSTQRERKLDEANFFMSLSEGAPKSEVAPSAEVISETRESEPEPMRSRFRFVTQQLSFRESDYRIIERAARRSSASVGEWIAFVAAEVAREELAAS